MSKIQFQKMYSKKLDRQDNTKEKKSTTTMVIKFKLQTVCGEEMC